MNSIKTVYADEIKFVDVPITASVEDKMNLIKMHWNQGCGIILDNFNTAFMGIPQIEALLNSLAMNKMPPHNTLPEVAGALIIGIQNPATKKGREVVSTPLLRRAHMLYFYEHTDEELHLILHKKNVPYHTAVGLLEAFNNKLNEAKRNFLSPKPSVHDLFSLIEEQGLKRKADIRQKPEPQQSRKRQKYREDVPEQSEDKLASAPSRKSPPSYPLPFFERSDGSEPSHKEHERRFEFN